MMYLSHLLVDVGNNPDRPRPGRHWLRNIYQVHQRLCMAFPSAERVSDDPLFLKPYDSGDFLRERQFSEADPPISDTTRPVHTPRSPEAGFLFRIDPQPGASPAVLVLSATVPNWEYAFQNAQVLLAAKPEVREYHPAYAAEQELRFRILMNLSKKSRDGAKQQNALDRFGRAKTQGKRVALTWNEDQRPEEVILPWFSAKAEAAGFMVQQGCALMRLGWVYGMKPDRSEPLKFRSALFEGKLKVLDPDAFREALASGIGSAKAFGFGLLSVAPVREE